MQNYHQRTQMNQYPQQQQITPEPVNNNANFFDQTFSEIKNTGNNDPAYQNHMYNAQKELEELKIVKPTNFINQNTLQVSDAFVNKDIRNVSNKSIKNVSENRSFMSNRSGISNNSRNPLNVNLNYGTNSRKSISRQSRNSFRNTDDLSDDLVMLNNLLTARGAEIRILNQKLTKLQEAKSKEDELTDSKISNKSGSGERIKKYIEEINKYRTENNKLEISIKELTETEGVIRHENLGKLQRMKKQFEDNANRNVEVMERELEFKFASDPDYVRNILQTRINDLKYKLQQKSN